MGVKQEGGEAPKPSYPATKMTTTLPPPSTPPAPPPASSWSSTVASTSSQKRKYLYESSSPATSGLPTPSSGYGSTTSGYGVSPAISLPYSAPGMPVAAALLPPINGSTPSGYGYTPYTSSRYSEPSNGYRGAAVTTTASTPGSSKSNPYVLDDDDGSAPVPPVPTSEPWRKKVRLGDTEDEKRQGRFRPKPPHSFHSVYERAISQKFYVLIRTRCGTYACPEEMIELTGSTGNIYNVCITRRPSCDCPHAGAGNQCKHILYVLSHVLRAKYEYVYQLFLLSTELQEIFDNAPPPIDSAAGAGAAQEQAQHQGGQQASDRRKPVEGECPICFCDMDPAGAQAVVWCRAACGQNIHRDCFQMWAATKRRGGGGDGDVTCPYCRSVWEGDADMVANVKRTGQVNYEGYVNAADQLGINPIRDESTYSSWYGRSSWGGSGSGSGYKRRRGYYY